MINFVNFCIETTFFYIYKLFGYITIFVAEIIVKQFHIIVDVVFFCFVFGGKVAVVIVVVNAFFVVNAVVVIVVAPVAAVAFIVWRVIEVAFKEFRFFRRQKSI